MVAHPDHLCCVCGHTPLADTDPYELCDEHGCTLYGPEDEVRHERIWLGDRGWTDIEVRLPPARARQARRQVQAGKAIYLDDETLPVGYVHLILARRSLLPQLRERWKVLNARGRGTPA